MAEQTAWIAEEPASADRVSRDPVAKAFGLLAHLVDSADAAWTARTLAGELGAPVSSTHRTLLALVRAGVLTQDSSTAVYEFSGEFHRVARRVISRFPLPDLAREHLREVAEATGETTLLGMVDRDANRMSFVAQAEGGHPLRYVIPLNTWVSLTQGASGLAVLSFLDERRRAAAVDEYQPDAEGMSREELLREIRLIRSRGYAVSHGQRISGATGIAAPVFDSRGIAVGDVVVTMPHVRFVAADEAEIVRHVTECADQLTRLAGGTTPPRKETN